MLMQPKTSNKVKSIPNFTEESITTQIMPLQKMISLMHSKNLEKFKDLPELIAPLETLADSIIILVYVKIGMTLDTVLLVIAAFIFMIGPIIKLDGNNRKILKEQKNKDGDE